jgi:hypothetical protein
MIRGAFERNNIALGKAVKFSENLEDLRVVLKQAHGVGWNSFVDDFKFILNEDFTLEEDRYICPHCGEGI